MSIKESGENTCYDLAGGNHRSVDDRSLPIARYERRHDRQHPDSFAHPNRSMYSHPTPKILYEDNHLLALEKPAGLPTQPSGTESPSLETEGRAFIKKRDHKPGNVFLHAVHRLDSLASGIVLFAKTQKALSRLSAHMREHEFHKTYIALVEGQKAPSPGSYVDFLVHGDHKALVVDPSYEGAKRSELVVVSTQPISPNRWKLTIELLTGRYHQIRAQLASRGFPIVGDAKYGSSLAFSCNAIALHHSLLSFPSPLRNGLLDQITIKSADPFTSL